MDLNQFLSTLFGGGIVLTISGFVFVRLIYAVDKLIERVNAIEIEQAILSPKVLEIDRLSAQVLSSKERLIRLETKLKLPN